ncbi:VOC family protein [Actinobacteria bacterium YIM 96077]|uniref:VOC family protein n=1 Tax=Phytoactinopolyspora halophila TaxID=1981511 RepID=A0A329R0N6_9ACTN|nr:VOC family protein [Phytoactinopolyspora halophila]AYY11644.1 VOC family protein [Actinobacteria bacterium YIM 96077]RAW17923.1 VOC family protein [Phytoactinopolyspora halophila]
MRLDHVSYAAGPDGLDATAQRLSDQLGVQFIDGGLHPRFGTRNRVLPLAGGHYVEVVAVLDHPAADQVPFGQAVKARSETGGGWLGWVVAVDDLAPIEQRLGRSAVQGNRKRPDGFELRWKQIGVKGLINDPQLPFFVRWESEPAEHPSKGGRGVQLTGLEIAGDPRRVAEWLGEPESDPLEDVEVAWINPNGQPGLQAVTFRTEMDLITI